MFKKILSLIFLLVVFLNLDVSVYAFTIKKGDIFVTNGTKSSGLAGHAAIANGNYYILDAPGIGKTTRQTPANTWIKSYLTDPGSWVKVYRVSSQYAHIASAAGSWADKNYYSTIGGHVQNIFPKYAITGNLYSRDPVYCSKIPYQAYYYASGSLPFMKDYSGINVRYATVITPYGLIESFNTKYRPTLVHTYYH